MKRHSLHRAALLGLSTLTLLFISSTGVNAQDAVIKKIIEEGTTHNLTQHHLDVLTNRIGGRPVGSHAYAVATAWAASQMEQWGLEVSVEEAGHTQVGFERGPWFGRLIGGQLPNGEGVTLHFATPSYTSGTKGVQRGHVLIEPKTQAEFDRMKGQLKGAWVLITGTSTGWPIEHSPEAHARRDSIIKANETAVRYNMGVMMRYRSQNSPATGDRRRATEDQMRLALKDSLMPVADEPALFYRQMEEAGVLGFIQSSPTPITSLYDKYVAHNPASHFENLPTLPDIKLDEHQYAYLYQMAKERRTFELEFDIRNHFTPGPIPYHNVTGKIKGSRHPEQYVIISGHLDAYDTGTGGVDCGVGVTPALEAARLLSVSGAKPKQSILFVLFAAEEFGLLGAEAWVKAHEKELPNISNLFNRDGGPTVPTGISVPEAMYQDFVNASKYIPLINPDFGFTVTQRPARPRPTSTGGTDASVFAIRGVPTLSFNNTDPKGYNFDYREIWHTERDTYSKSIDEYQEHCSVVQAIIAYQLANMDHILSREGLYLP